MALGDLYEQSEHLKKRFTGRRKNRKSFLKAVCVFRKKHIRNGLLLVREQPFRSGPVLRLAGQNYSEPARPEVPDTLFLLERDNDQ